MNTKSKHTPGPWKYSELLKADFSAICGDGVVVAAIPNMGYDMGDIDTIRANSRLIAAAPELLAALENIFSSMADKRGVIDWATSAEAEDAFSNARAAIAKAKGDK